jgi:hypothetical protein
MAGVCNPEVCPAYLSLSELESGVSEIPQGSVLADKKVRTSAIALCRALLEVGDCPNGPKASSSDEPHIWVMCDSSVSPELNGIEDALELASDFSTLTGRLVEGNLEDYSNRVG